MSRINVNQIKIVDDTALAADGSVIISSRVDDSRWSSNSKGSLLLPRGNTAVDRPTPPEQGHIRFNTDGSYFEGWNGTGWNRFGETRIPVDGGITCANPPLFFDGSPSTGFVSESPNTVSIATNGVCAAIFAEDLVTLNNGLRLDDESQTNLDFAVMGTVRSAIREVPASQRMEFSGSVGNLADTGEDVSFFIDFNTKDVCFIEPVKFAQPIEFGGGLKFNDNGSGDNYQIGSTTGIELSIDCENADTTSILKVTKHGSVDTGFSVDQDGTVTANDGTVTNVSYGFESANDTGWFYSTSNPDQSMIGAVSGDNKLILTPTYNSSTQIFHFIDGSAGQPSMTFDSDLDTGIFKSGLNEFAISTGGQERIKATNDCIVASVPVGLPAGNPVSPGLKFNDDGSTGIWLPAAGIMSFSAAGTTVAAITDSAFTMQGSAQVLAVTGSTSVPGYSFSGDDDTGIHGPVPDTIAIATNGADRVIIDDAETRVLNKLVIEGTVCYGSGGGGAETLNNNMITLAAGQTDTVLPAPLTYAATDWEGVFVDYVVKRDVGISVGTLMIANDGLSVNVVDQSSNVNDTGITFDAILSAGMVSVTYSSTAGNSATMRYSVKRMGL